LSESIFSFARFERRLFCFAIFQRFVSAALFDPRSLFSTFSHRIRRA